MEIESTFVEVYRKEPENFLTVKLLDYRAVSVHKCPRVNFRKRHWQKLFVGYHSTYRSLDFVPEAVPGYILSEACG